MKKTKPWILLTGPLLRSASAFVAFSGQGFGPSRNVEFVGGKSFRQHQSSSFQAVTVVPEADKGFTLVRVGTKSRASWKRKLVDQVFQRNKKLDESFVPSTTHTAGCTTTNSDGFIFQNFQSLEPSEVLSLDLLARVPREKSMVPRVEQALGAAAEQGSNSSPFLARNAENLLAMLVHRWTKGCHQNLRIDCDQNGGVIDLVKGVFRADATIEFDRLVFGAIRMSKGKLASHRMALNLYKYAPFCSRIPRFSQAFDIEAQDVTFSQDDLFESNCVRLGLRRLLRNILRNRDMEAPDVSINSINILNSGKLSICGSATTPFGSKVDFQVRSGLGVANRGHVLTFPGLEISLGPAVGLFVPVVAPISLDMGHNAAIQDIRLNGIDRTLRLSCRVTITPRHTLKLEQYKQTPHAFAACFHYDVGRWVTRMGRFSD